MLITRELLERRAACLDQAAIFAAEWPEGTEITLAAAMRAVELGLDLEWAAEHIMTEPAVHAYRDALASARRAHDEATESARRAHREATESACRAYDEAMASACRAYDEATASAFVAAFGA